MPEPQVATIEPTALSSAITGTIAKEIPGALAESKRIDAERSQAGREATTRLERDQGRREMLNPPTPPVQQHAPEMERTGQGDVWGSLAMSMAMIGSAFTRQPFLNALNAGAGVIRAFQQGDADAYKQHYQKWKDETEYGLKTYEFARDVYKDALDMIANDEKSALAIYKTKAAALKDDPMHRLAEAGNVGGIVSLEQQRADAHKQAVIETKRKMEEGAILGELLESGKGLREAQAAKDPAAIALATDRYTAAQAAAKDMHTAKTGSPAAGNLHPSVEFEIRDKDGKVVERVMARESAQGGPPVRTDTGQPLAVDTAAGQSLHKAPPASSGRTAVAQTNRLIGATSELTASLKNLVELPIDSNAGAFMGLQAVAPDTLKAAVGRVAATHLVGEQAIAVSQQFTGLQRQLATIESQGAAQGLVGLTNANNVLVPQSGWSGTAVMRSYAEIRQIAEANIRAMLASDTVSEPQKTLMRELQKEIETVVPYTVHDVNQLAFGGKKKFKESVSAFADKMLQRREADKPATGSPSPAPAASGAATPAPAASAAIPPPGGLPKVTGQAAYDALPDGARYLGPDGKEYVKGKK